MKNQEIGSGMAGMAAAAAVLSMCGPVAAPAYCQGIVCAGRDYLSTYLTPGAARDIALAGSIAYVSDYAEGLLVFDVSDPAGPGLVGSLDTPGTSGELAVEGSFAFIVAQPGGLVVVDVTDPAVPKFVSAYPGNFEHLAMSGTIACATFKDGVDEGIEFVDVSDPAAPKFLSRYETVGPQSSLAAADGRVYASRHDGFKWRALIIDISDPAAPTLLGTCVDAASPLTVAGGLLYAGGLSIFDVSDPASPSLLGGLESPGGAREITVVGDTAYLFSGPGGLQVVDVSDPAEPKSVGSYDNVRGLGYAGAVAGQVAYVCHSGGLSIIDVSDPKRSLLATYPTPGVPNDIVFLGNTAFVADGDAGLRILDLTDPAQPMPLGAFDIGTGATALAVEGSTAYVCDVDDGLFVVDVSDLDHPQMLGQFMQLPYSRAVAVSDGIVYAGRSVDNVSPNGLVIIDAQDPKSPALLGEIEYDRDWDNGIRAIAVRGGYAYIVRKGQFAVVDATDPASPVEVAWYSMVEPRGLTVVGDIAYVVFSSGLLMLDISDPLHPSPIGDYFPGGPAYDIAVVDGLAYWSASYLSGLRVVDVSNPLSPRFLGECLTPWQPGAVAVSNGIACVSSAYGDSRDMDIIDTRDCPPCPADLDGSGAVDLFDFLAFVNLFNAADPKADCDHNAAFDLFDFLCFVNAFNAGC